MLTPVSPPGYPLGSHDLVARQEMQHGRASHQREHSTNQDNNVNVLKRKIISHDVNDRKIPKEKQISKIPT
nr:hypothetical protein [Endozoicomonas sp.]